MLIDVLSAVSSDMPAVKLFKQWCVAYEKRDIKSLKNLFIKKTQSFGTGQDENLLAWSAMEMQLKRDYKQSKAAKLVPVTIYTGASGTWASGVCNAYITGHDNKMMEWKGLRFSIVVEKDKDGQWKIAHTHCSAPACDQPEGQSFPKG